MLKKAFFLSFLVVIPFLLFYPERAVNPVFQVQPPPVEKDKPPRDLLIVGLGDSLTKGVGDPTQKGYIGNVRERLSQMDRFAEVTVYNYGVRGDETADLLQLLESGEIRRRIYHADLLFMTIGGNDLMEVVENHFFNLSVELFQKKEKEYAHRLEKIIVTIRRLNPHAPLIYVGIFNPFSQYFSKIEELQKIVHSWNAVSRQTVLRFDHTYFIPTYDLFAGKKENLFSDDHFHPNARGYQLIAERIFQRIDFHSVPSDAVLQDASAGNFNRFPNHIINGAR